MNSFSINTKKKTRKKKIHVIWIIIKGALKEY